MLLGVFGVEEVTIPGDIEDTEDILLPTTIHPSFRETDQAAFDISFITNYLDQYSQGPGDGDEHPNPPAMFQLGFFLLYKST